MTMVEQQMGVPFAGEARIPERIAFPAALGGESVRTGGAVQAWFNSLLGYQMEPRSDS